MAPDSALASPQGGTPVVAGASGRSGWSRVTDEPLLAVLAAAVVGLLLWSLTSLGARISENGDRITRLEVKVDARFATVDERFDEIEVHLAGMELRLAAFEEKVDARFAAVDARLAAVDERFAAVDERFDEMEVRFDEMDAEIDEISENMAAVLAILRAGDNAAADGSESVVAASSESDQPN